MATPEPSQVDILVSRLESLERSEQGITTLLHDITKTQAVHDARLHAVEVTSEANRELMDHLTGRVAQLRDLIGEKFEALAGGIGDLRKEVLLSREQDAKSQSVWLRGLVVSIFLAIFGGIVVTRWMG